MSQEIEKKRQRVDWCVSSCSQVKKSEDERNQQTGPRHLILVLSPPLQHSSSPPPERGSDLLN